MKKYLFASLFADLLNVLQTVFKIFIEIIVRIEKLTTVI